VLLRLDYPVNAYFQAFRDEKDPAIPEVGPSATVVYRQGPTVWRMDLLPVMHEILGSLLRGDALEAALAHVEASDIGADGEEEAAQRVMFWFREWVSSGLFARVELG
jgi:hypothetical protein